MNDIKIPVKKGDFEVTQVHGAESKAPEPGDKVKVKFRKFVELVATHNVEGVMQEHENAEIILNTNLLTDLANAHEEPPADTSRKLPIIFIVGMIIGVILAYVLIRFIL